MSGAGFATRVEQWVFGQRKLLLAVFLLVTAVLFGFATQTKIDAGFEKQLPQGHPTSRRSQNISRSSAEPTA